MDLGNVADRDQVEAIMRNMAQACGLLREQLLAAGFNRGEALTLVGRWMEASIAQGSQQSGSGEKGAP